MRDTQAVEGLQLVFPDSATGLEYLKAVAEKFFAKAVARPKDKDKDIPKSYMYEYCPKKKIKNQDSPSPLICWCEDKMPRGYTGEMYVTVPYIILLGTKILAVDSQFADVPNEEKLEAFLRTFWAGHPEVIETPKVRKTRSAVGLFPKLLTDIVSTLEEFYQIGMSTTMFDGKDIPDYAMPIWLKRAVAVNLKETETYYDFLDRVRERSEKMALHTLKYEDAVEWLRENNVKIYEFMNGRGYFLNQEKGA